MSYDKPNSPSGRSMLADYNRMALHHFKLKKGNGHLTLHPVSNVPWVTAAKNPVEYNKEVCLKFSESNDSIELIKKNCDFDSFVWHTTAGKLKEATRWGIIKTQSVTGQVISALGKYRLTYLDRLRKGVISNRHSLKEKLLSHYQDRFTALQALESLANSNSSRDDFQIAIDKYTEELGEIKADLEEAFAGTNFSKADHDGVAHLEKEIAADIKRAQDFLQHYKFESANRATGIDSVLTFVKAEMARNLRAFQGHNQNITYSRKIHFAATRGDLNSVIEDAEKVIEEYNAPPRDSVWPDHHGDYGQDNERVVYDSAFHCPNAEELSALAITFIEGVNELDMKNPERPILKTERQLPFYLKVVNSPKWENSGGVLFGLKRFGAWFVNIAIKLNMGLIELPLTLLVEPLTFGRGKQFFRQIRKLATYEIKINPGNSYPIFTNTKGKRFLHKIKRRGLSLGLRLRHLAANAFKNTFQDALHGVRDVYKQFTTHLFDDVYNDYADGAKNLPTLENVFKKCEGEIETISKQEKIIWRELSGKLNLNADSFSELQKEILNEKYAVPGFIPSAGEYKDILSASADGFERFMAFFLHNIHAKHPFTGLLFTATYVAGGLAVVAPSSVAFLGSQYIAFSQTLGFSMSKSTFSAGISSAMSQAQIVSSSYELLLHGSESWIASGACNFERDPFTSLIYMGTALGFGYVVINQSHIPWLSEMLKNDMGTFPATSWAFIGAKLGVLTYELLSEHTQEKLENTKSGRELREYLINLYKQSPLKKEASQEEIDSIIDESLQAFLSAENIGALKAAHTKLKTSSQFQDASERIRLDIEKQLQRNKIMQFLEKNREHLSYLSAQSKHQLVQQFKQHFSFSQAQSLKQLLYPTETTSIFRNTLSIVIAYLAFLMRMLAAVVSSCLHLSIKPLQSASIDFGLKILKDLTRIGRAVSKVCKATYLFVRRHFKVVADVFINSGLGRLQALIANRHHIANGGYAISGKLDAGNESLRELCSTPLDAGIKATMFAHPVDTTRKTGTSSVQILRQLITVKSESVSSKEETSVKPTSVPASVTISASTVIDPATKLAVQCGPLQYTSKYSAGV